MACQHHIGLMYVLTPCFEASLNEDFWNIAFQVEILGV